MKRIICLLILAAITLSACGNISAPSLSDGVTPRDVVQISSPEQFGEVISDFGVRLFKESFTADKNTLISPLSVLSALAMSANGADNDTLAQMESVLGAEAETLNAYVKSYTDALVSGEKYKLSLANSIWFTDDERFTVNEEFLQTNADYYRADIYKAPFNKKTCNDINTWVKEKTDGMIKEVLDEIPADAIMYLINALAFEAEWMEIYEHHQVRDATFTAIDSTKRTVDMMYSDESRYLEDERATGFIKFYSGGKYAFAALLPNRGISLEDYVAGLDGEALREMLSEPTYCAVKAGLPKFEFEYDTEMSAVLSNMGMPDAFDYQNADFTHLGVSTHGNIFISRVIHKTYISVGERGTKAGAVTVIETKDAAAAEVIEPKQVTLDRPFLFMLIDTETNLPFFIGTVTDID